MFSSSILPLCLLLVATNLAPISGQAVSDQTAPAESSGPVETLSGGNSVTITELDTSEPYLWQMAAFAARQMSTKQKKFKLSTLSYAEQVDSTYRLKVTLQRVSPGQPIDTNVSFACHSLL